MLTLSLYADINVYLYSYMFIYNISLVVLFWTLFKLIIVEFKTLQSFSTLSTDSFYLLTLLVLFLSMAGVPPFLGFFSKLFIITLLVNNSFFLLYSLFFVVLFTGLYFYIQNLKFLNSTNLGLSNHQFMLQERSVLLYYYFTIPSLILLILGLVYVDDVLLFFTWICL